MELKHLSEGLFSEIRSIRNHTHEGVNSKKITHTSILPNSDLIPRAVFDYQKANSGTITSYLNLGNIWIQFGWSQVIGAAATSVTQAVTFPRAFTNIYFVIASFIGAKNNAAATSIGDTSALAKAVVDATAVTLTGFTAVVKNGDNTNLTSTMRYAYSWIAIGTKS